MSQVDSSIHRDDPSITAADAASNEQDTAARAVIERAAALVAKTDRAIPGSFAGQLFGRAASEDVVRYAPEDLANLSVAAWQYMAERPPGTPKIRFFIAHPKTAGEAKAVGVIEILTDDMPFLVDLVLAELNDRGLGVSLVLHPVFAVERDPGGKLKSLYDVLPSPGSGRRESFQHIHVAPIEDEARRAKVIEALSVVLDQVRLAVQDWRAMLVRLGDVVAELKNIPPPLPVDEIAEAIQFLDWLRANNFTFLGMREYAVSGGAIEPSPPSALGVLRDPEMRVFRRGKEPLELTPEIMAFLKEPKPLIITKANMRSLVHRRGYLDYVGVKRFDSGGQLIGELRIVGLFTSTAYTRPARSIPYLRRKIAAVERRAGFDPGSHSGKSLANVIENYPRDELFQIDEDTFFNFALVILQLDERPRVRVLARRDRLRPFRFGSGVRAARTLRQPHPRSDRRLSCRRFPWSRVGVLSVFP